MGIAPGDLSRKCLVAVREEKHIAVFSIMLRREWRNHAGLYATEWLRIMERKNQIVDHEGKEFSGLLNPACRALAFESQRVALAKDFHLIQSALATGQTILSNERKFPALLAAVYHVVEEFSSLHYSNPAVEGEACILWIKAGAENDADRQIDVWTEKYQNAG